MNDEYIELIEEIANEEGGEVIYGYSGRGMYGKECVAIACDDADRAIYLAGQKDLPMPVSDSMGRRCVVYWPNIKQGE